LSINKTYALIIFTVFSYNRRITADGGGAVVIANCTVVAFVNTGRADVLNAVEGAIK